MNHLKILKRAFRITLDYRMLWIFGILLALAAPASPSGSGGGSGGGGGGNGSSNGGFLPPANFHPEIAKEFWYGVVIAGVALVCVVFFLSLAFLVVRYVSETALIRMVDHHENTGEKLGFRQGLRLGWSKAAWRMFLVDLVIGVGGVIIFILLLIIGGAPLLLWLTGNIPIGVLASILSAGMIMLVIFFGILVAIVLSLLIQFIRRAVVLEDQGVLEAFRRGFVVMKRRLGDVVIMGLLMVGLGLAWVILSIPIVLLLVMVGTVAGGLPALLVGMLADLFSGGFLPWVLAGVVGIPIFLLVVCLPMLFLSGLIKVFASSTWTLTYREVLAMNGDLPAPERKPSLPEPVEEAKAEKVESGEEEASSGEQPPSDEGSVDKQ